MAFVLSVCGLKGGVGKSLISSTLACGFHRAGRKTLVIDADEQGTLRTWAEKGASNDIPPVIAMDARNLVRDIERVGADYEIAVVDTPARLGKEARAAMMRADLVLLPVVRGGPGIWTLDETLEILEEARASRPELPAYVVHNMVDHTTLSQSARERLAELPIKLVGEGLGYRVAFDEAMTLGADVVAYAPDSEAAREAKALFRAVEKLVTKGKR